MSDNSSFLYQAFKAHPASVNATYWQHARFAFGMSVKLFAAGGAALVHAIFPQMFETTASRIIREIHHKMENRH